MSQLKELQKAFPFSRHHVLVLAPPKSDLSKIFKELQTGRSIVMQCIGFNEIHRRLHVLSLGISRFKRYRQHWRHTTHLPYFMQLFPPQAIFHEARLKFGPINQTKYLINALDCTLQIKDSLRISEHYINCPQRVFSQPYSIFKMP